jgi:hypothetical protein
MIDDKRHLYRIDGCLEVEKKRKRRKEPEEEDNRPTVTSLVQKD